MMWGNETTLWYGLQPGVAAEYPEVWEYKGVRASTIMPRCRRIAIALSAEGGGQMVAALTAFPQRLAPALQEEEP